MIAPLLAIGTIIVAALALVMLRRWARGFLRPRGWRSDRTPESLGLHAEPFVIERGDGQLRGWLLSGAPGARTTIVFAHGWNSHAGEMLPFAEPLVRAGHRAVVYDALGHGESDAAEFTSLRHMRDDLDAVLAWTSARPDATEGVLFGHSMGGAAAILSAAAGAPIRALVCAAAPTDPLEITIEFLDARGLPGRLLVRVLVPFWRPIVAEPYETLRPIERLCEVRVPVLVLHGSADRQVSAAHAERLAARAPHAQLTVLEGAGHNDLPAHALYAESVLGFLADSLTGGERSDMRPVGLG